ncbi:MAG: hypothetical protein WBP93_06690 [Pyrinomonadaceae bacterium]
MSVNLNLASQPFRNRALPWTITTIITVASLVAFIFIFSKTQETNAQAVAVARDVAVLKQQDLDLIKRANEVKSALTPDQIQTLKAAHTLYDRKHFSWSRLFADLEATLPGSVRVTRIAVRDVVVRQGQTVAALDLSVVSKSPDAATEMITQMEHSGVFQAELLSQGLQKGRGETGTESTLSVRYTPHGGVPAVENTNNSSIAATTTATNSTANLNRGQQ